MQLLWESWLPVHRRETRLGAEGAVCGAGDGCLQPSLWVRLQRPGFQRATKLMWDLRPARSLSSCPTGQESRIALEEPESFSRHLRPGISETLQNLPSVLQLHTLLHSHRQPDGCYLQRLCHFSPTEPADDKSQVGHIFPPPTQMCAGGCLEVLGINPEPERRAVLP